MQPPHGLGRKDDANMLAAGPMTDNNSKGEQISGNAGQPTSLVTSRCEDFEELPCEDWKKHLKVQLDQQGGWIRNRGRPPLVLPGSSASMY